MGFSKIFKTSSPATIINTSTPTTVTEPATVTETQEVDMEADYAQRANRKRGLLSTLLSNRNRAAGLDGSSNGSGNNTLG